MRRSSIVDRLALWYVSSLFVLILCSSGILYLSLSRALSTEDTSILHDRLRSISLLLNRSPDPLLAAKRRVESEWASKREEHLYARILDARGREVLESPGFPPEVGPEVFSAAPVAGSTDALPKGRRITVTSGHPYLALGAVLKTPLLPGGVSTAYVVLDLGGEEALLSRYRTTLLVVLTIALLVSALLGRRLAIVAFRPLSAIVGTTQRIRSSTLHERLPESRLPVEFEILARTINEMLERLEEAFERLSRFSADIAHELRTPINNIRGEVEVALGKPRSAEEYGEVMGSCLEELGRISKIIDSLLFLAKAEDPKLLIEREKVRLSEELQRVLDFFEVAAADAGVTTEVSVPNELEIEVDRTLFQRAIGNLLANAITHTPSGGRILVGAARTGARVQISVSDTGEGISPEDLPKVFDRFFRADPARKSTRLGGFGLGLTIVKSIVALHGGEVHLQSRVGMGTTVTIDLPAA